MKDKEFARLIVEANRQGYSEGLRHGMRQRKEAEERTSPVGGESTEYNRGYAAGWQACIEARGNPPASD